MFYNTLELSETNIKLIFKTHTMAKEHASVGLLCLAMDSKHYYSPGAITFTPAYKKTLNLSAHDRCKHVLSIRVLEEAYHGALRLSISSEALPVSYNVTKVYL